MMGPGSLAAISCLGSNFATAFTLSLYTLTITLSISPSPFPSLRPTHHQLPQSIV